MNHIKISIILCVFVLPLLLCCCHRHSKAWESMDEVEKLIESHPDSALAILNVISPSILKGDRERARYALQKSIAMDKNYIDTTTFDVLQPAIEYYTQHGTPDEKLRTYYYQGIIFQNAGKMEEASEAFMWAEDCMSEATDTLTMARALFVIAKQYDKTYNFKKHVEYALRSAELFKSKGANASYTNALLMALNKSIILKDRLRADSIMAICLDCEKKGYLPRSGFFDDFLVYAVEMSGNKKDIIPFLAEADTLPLSPEGKMIVANAYRVIGQPEKAIEIFERLEQSSQPLDTMKFWGTKSILLDKTGDYKGTVDLYKDFMSKMYLNHVDMFDHKIKHINQLHEKEIMAEQAKRKQDRQIALAVIVIIVLVFIIVILVLLVRSHRLREILAKEQEYVSSLEKETLLHRVKELELERDRLTVVLEAKENMPEEVYRAIRSRIKMLNSLLAEQIVLGSRDSGHKPIYEKWAASRLEDQEKFMNETRLAFQISHPHFIREFEEKGLSNEEINYLCLYAIGLNGKEVGRYLQRAGHINFSSAIRKKLGLDKHDTNMRIYVQRLLNRD